MARGQAFTADTDKKTKQKALKLSDRSFILVRLRPLPDTSLIPQVNHGFRIKSSRQVHR